MPVITPARPFRCTTYNINKSARHQIVNEFKRASNIITLMKKKTEIYDKVPDNNLPYEELRDHHGYTLNNKILYYCSRLSWNYLFLPK